MSAKSRFVPLHAFSWYSLNEGVDPPARLLERAASLGYAALGLTDVNSLAGCLEFCTEAQKCAVRPILGARLRHQGQRATALIAEAGGWRSLSRIISRIRGDKPPPFTRLLCECAEGLQLLTDDERLLKPPVSDVYLNRLWVEVVRPALPQEKERALLEVGARVLARPVASLGVHFAAQPGYETYRLLTAIRQGKTLRQLAKRLSVVPAYHLADVDEVHSRFQDLPEAIANTARLADLCRADVLPRGAVLPPARVPPGQDADSYLRLLCERALPARAVADEPAAGRRLAHELQVVAQHGMAPYLLTVALIAGESRRQNWPMALHGSAGSSLVWYLLGITDVDPLKYGLRPERFLHPGPDAPDIDLDFATQFRASLFAWVVAHFGKPHVARVGLWQHWRARGAFAAAAKAHGVDPEQVRVLAEALGEDVEALEHPEGREEVEAAIPPTWPLDPAAWQRLPESARLLLGRPHELAHHPSGFVLVGRPVEEYAPLERGPGGVGVTQFHKAGVERLGMVTIDLLSSRSLSTLLRGGAAPANAGPAGRRRRAGGGQRPGDAGATVPRRHARHRATGAGRDAPAAAAAPPPRPRGPGAGNGHHPPGGCPRRGQGHVSPPSPWRRGGELPAPVPATAAGRESRRPALRRRRPGRGRGADRVAPGRGGPAPQAPGRPRAGGRRLGGLRRPVRPQGRRPRCC
jgi:DNA polymerase III alpha subunit